MRFSRSTAYVPWPYQPPPHIWSMASPTAFARSFSSPATASPIRSRPRHTPFSIAGWEFNMKARRKSKAEEALRESQALYRQLIRGVPVAIYITDEQGFLTLWNAAAEALWGRVPTAGQ